MAVSQSSRGSVSLTELARLGFADLTKAKARLEGFDPAVIEYFSLCADPDQALHYLEQLKERSQDHLVTLMGTPDAAARLIRVLGASSGLGDFFRRRPDELDCLSEPLQSLPSFDDMRSELRDAVFNSSTKVVDAEHAVMGLRVRYRRLLARIAAFDLEQEDQLAGVDAVALALADLAGAAIDVALSLARDAAPFPAEEVRKSGLAVIGMGKTGAQELNYLSDVDVIYIAEAKDGIEPGRAVEIATWLAMQLGRIVQSPGVEPELWELDANLRPEGQDGALVRSLDSHLAYYSRWAKDWEFQALLKARPIAGDMELGARYIEAVSPLVWSSASRENFVESVQRMRERVTAHIPPDEADVQLKLGRGGLRDIEFTIQLLQLVHGQTDEDVRQRGTLPALFALAEGGYIGRDESALFSDNYRFLRLLEHRLQLSRLQRTHLMPRDDNAVRVLARASGLASTSKALMEKWRTVKTDVRSLHERLFYRPCLPLLLPCRRMVLPSRASRRLRGWRQLGSVIRMVPFVTLAFSRQAFPAAQRFNATFSPCCFSGSLRVLTLIAASLCFGD